MYDTKSCISFHNDSGSINLFRDSVICESSPTTFLPRDSNIFGFGSYENESIKNAEIYSLCEVDTVDNLKNNFEDEEYNLNYTIELTRQELENCFKRESDKDMKIFCNF